MAVVDKKMAPASATVLKHMSLALGTTATGQTAKKTDAFTVPFAFQITRVEVNALTVTATISVDVQIGTTSILASTITPVAATPTAGTLSTTAANLKGASGSTISVLYTSDGSGAATNGIVRVWFRPRPLNGEV